MLAVVLALASSVVWGVSDFLGGLKSRSLAPLGVLLVSQGTGLVLLVAAVVALGAGPPDGPFLLAAALGGVAEAVGVAALYRGLAVGAMGVVAPLAATAPVVPVAVGAIRGELPSPAQWAGIAVAVVGIVLVSRSAPPSPTAMTRSAGIASGLMAALGFGGSFVGTAVAAEGGVTWALLGARITTVALFLAAAVVLRPPVATPARQLPVLAVIGVLVLGADALYALATTHGLLGVVAVLSSLFPVVTIVLARLVLHERLRRRQQGGAVLCLAGATGVTLG